MGLIGYRRILQRWIDTQDRFAVIVRDHAAPATLNAEQRAHENAVPLLREWLHTINAQPGYYKLEYVAVYDDERGEDGAAAVWCYLDWPETPEPEPNRNGDAHP